MGSDIVISIASENPFRLHGQYYLFWSLGHIVFYSSESSSLASYKAKILHALKSESSKIDCTFASHGKLSDFTYPEILVKGLDDPLAFPLPTFQASELKKISHCI